MHLAHRNRASVTAVTATFSMVAVDPETGVCGVAVASKWPAVGKVVPFVRPGVGAFCTQAWSHSPWGRTALDRLESGRLPEDVLAELLREDELRDKRQLALIDMSGRAAIHIPSGLDADAFWWGAMSGRFYACQGNTLVGRTVVEAMAKAYEETASPFADRLMAALMAGDRAGGDHRGRLAAALRLAKTGIRGNWLELDVDDSANAVCDLARLYRDVRHDCKSA